MNLYLDKPNLYSLIKQLKSVENYNLKSDCIRMIRNQLRLIYNFDKSEIDEMLFELWFNDLVQARGNKEELDSLQVPPFPNRPISTSLIDNSDWSVVSSVYCCTDKNVQELCREGRILISNDGGEINTLSELFWGDYDFHKRYDLTHNGISFGWKELKQDGHCLPCSDIMIVDRYLFNNHDCLNNNLYSLLLKLTDDVKAKVNIVIFVQRLGLSSVDFERYVKEISNLSNKLNVTIIVYPSSMEGDRKSKKIIPHDRFIITNYRIFTSGPSFNEYFDLNGNLSTNGSYLDVDSLAKIEKYMFASGQIDFFQKNVVDRLLNICSPSSYIFGSWKSNLFSFKNCRK